MKKTKNKLKIFIILAVLLVLFILAFNSISKSSQQKVFREELKSVEKLVEQQNAGKDFTRYEPFEGPNTGEAPFLNTDNSKELIINNNL